MVYRERGVAGKIEDAGVPGTFVGYGYVDGKNGSRVRIGNTNKVGTFRDVVCGIFPTASAHVGILTNDDNNTVQPAATETPRRARREVV